MRGRQVFMDSLRAHGVGKIFGNPGTTENPLLDSLLDYPDIEYVTALHESVAVFAASFYTQAANRPAVVNLHVAPGLGNGIGAIYGALKARSPVVITAGQQDTRMRMRSPLLSHNLVAMAEPVTKWAAEPASADEIGPIMQRAFKIAQEAPAGPVFVALPINVMEQETEVAATTMGFAFNSVTPDRGGVDELKQLLANASAPAILAGDEIARSGAFHTLVLLAEQLGAPVYNDPLRAQLAFPNHHPNYAGRMPLEASSMQKVLAHHDLVLMIGGVQLDEVWFDDVSPLAPGTRLVQIECTHAELGTTYPVDLGLYGDLAETLTLAVNVLQELPAEFARSATARNADIAQRHANMQESANAALERLWEARPMAPARALRELAEALPGNSIVVDESITASVELARVFAFNEPGDYIGGRGGGIGQGIAGAIGVQVAQPDRTVIAISGDGSAMYSIQALWSAAHHKLPIVFVILSNREYRVLKHNMDIYRARFNTNSNKPYPEMDLDQPAMNFVDIARGYGLRAEQVTNAADIKPRLAELLAHGEPALLDIVVSGKEFGIND